jgi:hypothetical protein
MTEAVFAGKEIEQFSPVQLPALLAPIRAPFANFAEYLFMRDGPRNCCYGNGYNQKPDQI